MEFNRNQFFFAGMLVLLIGIQFRMVASYELTPEASKILAQRPASASAEGPPQLQLGAAAQSAGIATPRKVIEPPEWLGWCLMSVGAVLILHSLSMRKPD